MQTDPAGVSTPSTAVNPQYQVVNLTSTLFTVTSTQTVDGTPFTLLDNGTWQSPGSENVLDLSKDHRRQLADYETATLSVLGLRRIA